MSLLPTSSPRVAAPSYPAQTKAVTFPVATAPDALSGSRTRMLVEALHDRQVLRKMMFTVLAGIIMVLAAIFTTVLELPTLWRYLWLGVCVVFFLLMFAGVAALTTATERSDGKDREGQF
jgi:hypothetical protein